MDDFSVLRLSQDAGFEVDGAGRYQLDDNLARGVLGQHGQIDAAVRRAAQPITQGEESIDDLTGPIASDHCFHATNHTLVTLDDQNLMRYGRAVRFSVSSFAGSRYAPCQRTAQCRCGPVTRPVAPLRPSSWPFATR